MWNKFRKQAGYVEVRVDQDGKLIGGYEKTTEDFSKHLAELKEMIKSLEARVTKLEPKTGKRKGGQAKGDEPTPKKPKKEEKGKKKAKKAKKDKKAKNA